MDNIKPVLSKYIIDVDNIYKNVSECQKRNNKYKIIDVFRLMIQSSFKDNYYSDFVENYNDLSMASSGNISYWTNKIYDIDISNYYASCYNSNNKQLNHIDKDLHHIFDKFIVNAVDGSCINCSVNNLSGKNLSSITISSILDVSNKMFFNYDIAFDNNENKILLKQPLTKKNLIIADRGYSNICFLKQLIKKTNFVIRLKKNLSIVKNFVKKNIDSDIIRFGNYKLKLVRYYVNKKTRKLIINKYKVDGKYKPEDEDDLYVIATNITSLTNLECSKLYSLRWSVEVAFKHLKSNFKVRHICKEDNSKNPIKKTKYWLDVSFYMYNLSRSIKNNIDNSNKCNCRYSKLANIVRNIMVNKIENIDDIIDKFIIIAKRFRNNRNPNANIRKINKKGKYKSFFTIQTLNSLLDDNG